MSDTVTISRKLARDYLLDTMSEISELAWSANWMIGTEISLLVAITDGNRNDFFPPELLSRARELAEALNEWPDPEADWDYENPAFIPFDIALAKYGSGESRP